ncbi:hypothetical protein CASFOL_006915 [Castilleja foliolosa]|uniref:F-box domain-containing protein n=1 Tax=Castilleja foliolosa TaxID=1961234 RepID=A0ABD3E9S2_9LAMI
MNSAEIVVSIDDLLQEILIRVPIKPLSRFQLVSKHWHSLISNPRFCCRVRSNPAAVGIFYPPSQKYRVTEQNGHEYRYIPFGPNPNRPQKIDFTQNPYGIQFYPSCNGLLLCRTYPGYRGEPRFYVYNPTTNKFSAFPKPGGNVNEIGYMHLVFDPSKSHHYKVVCIKVVSMEKKLCQVEVYSSETRGPWVKCGGPFKADVDIANGVYWSGAIHWLKHLYGGSVIRESLYFNPDDLHHLLAGPQIMPTPPTHHRDYRCFDYYFGESCNHLHYIPMVSENTHTHFTVYEMRADYSEWFVKYRVEGYKIMDACWDNLKPEDSFRFYNFRILTMVRGDKEEDTFLIFKYDRKIMKYNLVSGAFETIYEFEEYTPNDRDILFEYIESICRV